jgi:hypothetical protein
MLQTLLNRLCAWVALGSGPINFIEAFKPLWFNPANRGGFYEQSLLAERRPNGAASAIFSNEPRQSPC